MLFSQRRRLSLPFKNPFRRWRRHSDQHMGTQMTINQKFAFQHSYRVNNLFPAIIPQFSGFDPPQFPYQSYPRMTTREKCHR